MRVLLLLITCIFLSAGLAEAEFVHYFDENGKIHYVNTSVSKVPERYLDQIQGQLIKDDENSSEVVEEQAPEDVSLSDISKSQNEENSYGLIQALKIEFFTSLQCEPCKKLQIILNANKIPFTIHDVDLTGYGRETYLDLGGGDLPILKVGTQVYRGYDPAQLGEMMRKLKSGDIEEFMH